MTALVTATVTAFWLGLLTSVSPCPLATNIAAMSYIARRVDNPWASFLTGLLYTAGRTLAYLVLGLVLVNGLLAVPTLSQWLQLHMNQLLGPILIISGMLMLEMITIPLPSLGTSERLQQRADAWGLWGAGLLGFVFALAFCPVSAALFFGSLVPVAVTRRSGILLPSVYGVATGLPVLAFAVLIAIGAYRVGRTFNRVTVIEWWARRMTGAVFIFIGVCFALVHIFGVSLSL